jgi:hypothetical protein
VPNVMRVTMLLLVAFHLVAPTPLHAYVDPAAGSLAIQIAAAVILGGLVTARRWWISIGDAAKQIWRKIRPR